MGTDEGYRIQENTMDPAYPSVDSVIDPAVDRAADPRPVDHPNGHFDQYIKDAAERFGEDAVGQCIHLTLAGGHTHRMAGTPAFGEDEYVWGIKVGVAVTAYLRELHQENASSADS